MARGGSYLLNVGPDGRGRIPEPAKDYLIKAGMWIKDNPDTIYGAGPSPWGMVMPWGDVTTKGDKLNLVVFDWPQDRRIHLSGFEGDISSVRLRAANGKSLPLKWTSHDTWTAIEGGDLPAAAIAGPASVIEVQLKHAPKVDRTPGVHPNIPTPLLVEFAEVSNATKKEIRWMEKFGEWKHMNQVSVWKDGGKATWTVDVAQAGHYYIDLTYKGEDRPAWKAGEKRPVWKIMTDEGQELQNQQASSSVYNSYPFGLIKFKTAGKHTISASLVDGDPMKSSLSRILLTPAN